MARHRNLQWIGGHRSRPWYRRRWKRHRACRLWRHKPTWTTV